MNRVLITTTNSLEGKEIENYLKMVSTNVVIGTNYFSDLKAAITDIIGGYSDTYQEQLRDIYEKAINNLKKQTISLGGNAIVGLKIDFDEISGQGKSMFMISAIGMAVKLSEDIIDIPTLSDVNQISCLDLNNAITKSRILLAVNNNKYLDKTQWEYLLRYPFIQVIDRLLTQYTLLKNSSKTVFSDEEKLLLDNFDQLLAFSNQSDIQKILYSHILDEKYRNTVVNKIKYLKLFSPQKVIVLIESNNIDLAINCLSIEKEYYTKEDLEYMKSLINLLDTLPDQGKIMMVKGGIMSKEKEKFVCVCGNKNDIEDKYCFLCGRDIKGLDTKDYKHIKIFKEKVSILSELLK